PRRPDAAAAGDAALPVRGRQREAGGGAAGGEHADGPLLRQGAVPPLRRREPARAAGLLPSPLRPPPPRAERPRLSQVVANGAPVEPGDGKTAPSFLCLWNAL